MFIKILDIITIGLPFCVFKAITGLLFNLPWFVVLAAIDLIINLLNLVFLFIFKRTLTATCLISLLVGNAIKTTPELKEQWHDLGSAIDVLLSFILVAIIIGGGYIKDVPSNQIIFWNIAVVLNVLGAGYSRMASSIKNIIGKN